MKQLSRTISFVAAILVASLMSSSLEAKSYSSGGGRSYSSSSSHSSSSHSSSGSSRSSSSGGSSSRSSSTRTTSSGSSSTKTAPGSSTKSYKSGTGKSYSSGSTWNDDSKKSYTSGKSYTAGANRNGSSSSSSPNSKRNDSEFTFDTAAARAKREADSKTEYNQFKSSQNLPAASRPSQTSGNVGGQRDWVYVPDTITVRTRPARQYNLFSPYWSRPVVVYRDPYSSFFWWWLLDRSLEDRAWWAYHHRFDMDPARYQSLLA